VRRKRERDEKAGLGCRQAGVAIAIVTRMGQDKPGVLQDWLGSKNRARAEGIAKISWHERLLKTLKNTILAEQGSVPPQCLIVSDCLNFAVFPMKIII